MRVRIGTELIPQMNRADPVLLEYMKYHVGNVDPSKGETYEKAKKFGQILIDNCELSSPFPFSRTRYLAETP